MHSRCNLKGRGDCKVVSGENVARPWMEGCHMALEIKKWKQVKAEPRIKW